MDGADRDLVLARDGEQDLVDAGIDPAALERVQRSGIEMQPGIGQQRRRSCRRPHHRPPLPAAGSTAASTAAPGCTATGRGGATPPAATERWRG